MCTEALGSDVLLYHHLAAHESRFVTISNANHTSYPKHDRKKTMPGSLLCLSVTPSQAALNQLNTLSMKTSSGSEPPKSFLASVYNAQSRRTEK
jgi:hypothetical protein